MALINASASIGVAWRSPGKSSGSLSIVSLGRGVGSADGSGIASAAGSGTALGPARFLFEAAELSTCGFFGKNERQFAPNQHILPATTSACHFPRAPSGLLGRQSKAAAVLPVLSTRTASTIASSHLNVRSPGVCREPFENVSLKYWKPPPQCGLSIAS